MCLNKVLANNYVLEHIMYSSKADVLSYDT